jgi:GAF domain-containing protein
VGDPFEQALHIGDKLGALFMDLLPISGAAISVFDQSRRTSLIHSTDTTATRLEELHFDLGEGPLFDAFAGSSTVFVPDLAVAERWPAFLRSATELRVGAIFVFPLMLGAACTGGVTCYRTTPGPLDDEAIEVGTALSHAVASPASLQALVLAQDEPAENSSIELRREVHQATGMVLWQLNLSATDAFSRIRAYAFSSGSSVQEVAHDVVSRRLNFAELPE